MYRPPRPQDMWPVRQFARVTAGLTWPPDTLAVAKTAHTQAGSFSVRVPRGKSGMLSARLPYGAEAHPQLPASGHSQMLPLHRLRCRHIFGILPCR